MIIKDLPLGSLVKDPNTKYNGKPIVWKLVGKDLAGYPANSATLMTNNIISIKTFDAKEPSNSNTNRQTSGNNRWLYSNMRQWLNSTKPSPWFTATNSSDTPPSSGSNGNSYDTEDGFLTNFSSDFANRILKTDLKTIVPSVDGGGVETVQDNVFLFSMTEMGLAGSSGKEGTTIPYLNSSSNRILKPTDEAVTQSKYQHSSLNSSSNYYYWLRSAYPDFGHIVYRININGAFAQSVADNDTIGVAPALNLDSNSTISHQDTDGVYVLAFEGSSPKDLSGIKFTLIDKNTNINITTENRFSNSVKLDWNADDSSIAYTIKLKKDGIEIPYSRLQSLSENGKYSAIITAKDKAYPTNTRDSNEFTFYVLPPKKDLDNISFTLKDLLTSSQIVEGSKFVGKFQPYWEEIDGTNITVNYNVNNAPKGSLVKSNTYSQAGLYQVSYLITDKNYPDNQATGIINFEVTAAPEDWNDLVLDLRDAITTKPISEGSQFEAKVQPTWKEDSNITYGITVTYNNSLISYKKGDTLTNIGQYTIKFNLTDKNYPDNKKEISVNFEIIEKITDLDTYEMEFIDVNLPEAPNTIISEGKIFKDQEVKPYWQPIPADCTIISYTLERDESTVPFTPNNDVYTDYGNYSITVVLENGAGENKTFIRNFIIAPINTNLDIEIYNDFDETEINEGRIFEDELVLPTWDEPEDCDVDYTLRYDGEDFDFMKDLTVLSNKGDYELELIITEIDNPTNTTTVVRHFSIVDKKVDMNEIALVIVNAITDIPIQNNDVYKGIQVKPFWYTGQLPSNLDYESWITYNGTRRSYDPTDDEDILTEYGDYVVEVKISDHNFPTNYKMVVRNFKLMPGSIDITGKELIIKNKLTGSIIEEGQVFRGKDVAVQPTWDIFAGLKYEHKLYLNGTLLSSFKREDTIRDKGAYRLVVTATDPNYPENKIEISLTFSLTNDLDVDGNENEDAYLNGLPYVMGTPIIDSGDYNLLVVRRKKSNFMVSMSDVNFIVFNPNEEQKPLILADPEYIPSIKDTITIRYPNYGSEFEYKIDSAEEWQSYSEPFDVTDNCIIHARYKDPNGYFVEDTKAITNIDKLPPEPPVVMGFKEGVSTYLTVSPTVQYVYGVEFTATLNGEPYEIGSPIYNEVAEIRDYTLVVTAKKRLNGLTATTIVKFTLDSVPPEPPKIVGVLPEVIQESARPDIDSYEDNPSYKEDNEFEAKLNGRSFKLGTLLNDPNSYQLSVTAIKKINGLRATSYVVFTIIDKIPEPIGPLRISLEPLTEQNKVKAIDGEMVVDRDTGHISIYDDGYLISKTKELEELLALSEKRAVAIDISLQNNEQRINDLKIMKDVLREKVTDLQKRNYEIENDVNTIKSILSYLDFTDLSVIDQFKNSLEEIGTVTSGIRVRIEELRNTTTGKTELALQIMDGLQNNSSLIGETIWYKNNT
ncbi:hypothetical protein Goe21_02940 [Bacillus phage vB_BsuM-Goe21]|nr:hypothetical protein Goe21_02940 [Bacillus phage vB_BsuM-Goe21]